MNFLPGWHPGFITGAKLTTVTVFATATAQNSATITAPANIQAGDLIVMVDQASGGIVGTPPAAVTPTNFTALVTSFTAGTSRMCVSYKLAVGTEGGTSITGMAGASGGGSAKVMYVFRGNKAATALTVASANSQGTTGNPNPQSVTASGGVAPLVVLGFYGMEIGTAGAVNPRTFTVGGVPAKDGETEAVGDSTLDVDTWLAYKIYNTAPADVSVDMDDEGAGSLLASGYIQMVG
jgi:hypothetical protein